MLVNTVAREGRLSSTCTQCSVNVLSKKLLCLKSLKKSKLLYVHSTEYQTYNKSCMYIYSFSMYNKSVL